MIKTRFETSSFHPDGARVFEIIMPFRVQVGDEIEIDETGRNFEVTSACVVISEETNQVVEMIAKIR